MTLDYSGSLVVTVGNIPETAIPEMFTVQKILAKTGKMEILTHLVATSSRSRKLNGYDCDYQGLWF